MLVPSLESITLVLNWSMLPLVIPVLALKNSNVCVSETVLTEENSTVIRDSSAAHQTLSLPRKHMENGTQYELIIGTFCWGNISCKRRYIITPYWTSLRILVMLVLMHQWKTAFSCGILMWKCTTDFFDSRVHKVAVVLFCMHPSAAGHFEHRNLFCDRWQLNFEKVF